MKNKYYVEVWDFSVPYSSVSLRKGFSARKASKIVRRKIKYKIDRKKLPEIEKIAKEYGTNWEIINNTHVSFGPFESYTEAEKFAERFNRVTIQTAFELKLN